MVTKKKKKRETYYYNYLQHVITSRSRRRRRRRIINQLLLLLLLMNTSRTSNAGGGSNSSSSSSSSSRSSITLQQQQEAEAEAAALMSFKQSSIWYDPSNFLSSWSYNTSHCSWSGITCSSGGLVTSIDLSHRGLSGALHLSSLLSPSLPALLHLHLQGNSLCSPAASSPAASYCSLESLDLSNNNLSDPIPGSSFLGVCGQRLRYLNLSGNSIPGGGGSIPVGPSLEKLDLSRNRISDLTLLNSSCHSLSLLNLSNNHLSGPLGSSSWCCHSLSVLDLSYNNLSSGFSTLDLSGCPNLRFLSLSHNRLSDASFPNTLPKCHLLETLDLSHNELLLPIPGALLGGLQSIRELSLAHNHLFGEVPPELGRACATLGVLDLSGNKLTGGLPPTFLSCSSLHTLNLGNNLLSGDFLTSVVSSLQGLNQLYVPFNNITGPIPSSLGNCTRLEVMDLSSNAFTGHVPSNLCSPANAPPLRRLLLANNYLSGQLPPELGYCSNLTTIDLSFNNLDGPIPWELWSLPSLSDLVMWANNLTGEIPQGICSTNGATLQTLILNNNLLSGSIPQSIAKCTSIVWVSLSSNALGGEITAGMGSLVSLAILQLGKNALTGPIPAEIGKCKSLIWLDLNSNELSGAIPAELAEQSGLIVPGMASGKQFAFVRNEGGSACRGAGGLVEFEGIRAERLEKFPMVRWCGSTRIYTGMTVYTFGSNGSMIYLDVSYNSLGGSIPEELGSMSYLQVLNLGHNMVSGEIPESLGGLKAIGVMDLSHNHLRGSIPSSLGTLSFLNDLDLSNNNLSGLIPSGGQLTTFPASRYENNSALCGLPLPPCSPTPHHHHPTGHPTHHSLAAAPPMLIALAFFLLCLSALSLALYRQAKNNNKDKNNNAALPPSLSDDPLSINVATFEKPLRKLTFAHLLEATNGFSAESLIGSGGFGEVYKAQLKDGCVVAIKKLIQVTGQGDREFIAEMETIGKIKHRNLVPLLGYCKVGEERLLVYEYMKWGSLEAVLHDRSKGCSTLDWAARKKIAIGAARGLAFLHHSCLPHIIHRDMKSSNVLLDENMEARVSDFGMARLVNALDTHLSVSTLAGTPGYVPPEYYQSFRCTTKGDVYSYGVILLELVSGRKAIDPGVYGEDNNLVGWAKQLHKDKRSWEILDTELTHHHHHLPVDHHSQIALSLSIAFHCLDDRPFRRPTMIQVLTRFRQPPLLGPHPTTPPLLGPLS